LTDVEQLEVYKAVVEFAKDRLAKARGVYLLEVIK